MPRFRPLAALAALLLAAGCTDPVPAPVPAPDSGVLIEGAAYEVLSIDGRRFVDGSGAGFTLRGGRLEGSDGCNRMWGPVEQTAKTLRIGPLASTRMACPPPVMAAADALHKALAAVDGARRGPGGTAVLTAAGRDRVILRQQRR